MSPARKQRATPDHFRLTRSARPDSPLHYAAFSFSFMMDFYLRTSRTEPSAVRDLRAALGSCPVPALSSASGRSRDGRARPSVEVAGDFRRQPSRPSRVSRAPGPRATAFSRPINQRISRTVRAHTSPSHRRIVRHYTCARPMTQRYTRSHVSCYAYGNTRSHSPTLPLTVNQR